jgi:glycerophosphoryl diester phosphodiesterase
MPTFEELLKLCDGVDMMLNIELKAPRDPEIKKLYNIQMCCQIVHD